MMSETNPAAASVLPQNDPPPFKLYKAKSIGLASFLGGPLAVTYLVAANFKSLGDKKRQQLSWVIGVLSTIVLFVLAFSVEKMPNHLMPFIYTGIAYGLVEYFQGKNIEQHSAKGGAFYSGWRAAGIGMIGLVVTTVPLFGFAFATDPTSGYSKKGYGINSDEIYYKPAQYSVPEINTLADKLVLLDFFNNGSQKWVLVERAEDRTEIKFPLVEGAWDEYDVQQDFSSILPMLSLSFPGEKVVIILCDGELKAHKTIE